MYTWNDTMYRSFVELVHFRHSDQFPEAFFAFGILWSTSTAQMDFRPATATKSIDTRWVSKLYDTYRTP